MPDLDRSSPIPMYYQIAVDLRQRISRGEWRLNDQLPPEYELAAQYNVSRTTMRQALAQLESDGILHRQRGSGTFITRRPDQLVLALSFPYSFTAQAKKIGANPSSKIIKAEVGPLPSPEIAAHLGLGEDEQVASFVRLFMTNNQPVAVSRSTIPHQLCPGIASLPLINNSLIETFSQRYDLAPTQADQWIASVRAPKEEAGMLGMRPGAPILMITTLSLLADSTPLEYAVTYCDGNRLRLHSHIAATNEAVMTSIGIEAIGRPL